MTNENTPLVFVPSVRSGAGTGHLRRCLGFASDPRLRDRAVFHVPLTDRERILTAFPALGDFPLADGPSDIPGIDGATVVLDLPRIDLADVTPWLVSRHLMALDSLGAGLAMVPLLFDLLPRLRVPKGPVPNLSLPEILFPARRAFPSTRGEMRHILASFGGEDPAGLRRVLVRNADAIARIFPHARVELVRGPSSPALDMALPEGWQESGPFPDLNDAMERADLVFTAFGLTALEARARALPQVHLCPTAYHRSLSIQEGFPVLGNRKWTAREEALLHAVTRKEDAPGREQKPASATAPDGVGRGQFDPAHPHAQRDRPLPADFPALINLVEEGSPHACPGCGTPGGKVVNRQEGRSFLACPVCGLTRQVLLGPCDVGYGDAYFDNEYRAQYGRSYLEDFAHIKAMGTARARRIRRITGPGEFHLLDIGCAFGPFMDAARDEGFMPSGVDVNAAAVEYVHTALKMPARVLDFRDPHAPLDRTSYDVVTLWYVIEHFPELQPVLSSLARLVRPGGILALGTPSGDGVSARLRTSSFLARSPRDHHTVWHPSRVGKILERFGFRVESVVSTGHHPERFPGLAGHPALKGPAIVASRLFGLGDTFEVIARRLGPPGPAEEPSHDA